MFDLKARVQYLYLYERLQQKLEKMMNERFPPPVPGTVARKPVAPPGRHIPDDEAYYGQAEKASRMRG